MADFDVNVNIHISADNNFVNALSDIAGCWAAISMAKSGNTAARLPEKTVTPPERPAEPVKKAEPKKATKAEEKPLKGEPVTREKAKEINDIVDMPDKKAEPEKKPEPEPVKQEEPAKEEPKKDDADEAAKRDKMKELFTKAATEGKAAACKALLKELGVARQSQIPADKLDEALAKVEAL